MTNTVSNFKYISDLASFRVDALRARDPIHLQNGTFVVGSMALRVSIGIEQK